MAPVEHLIPLTLQELRAELARRLSTDAERFVFNRFCDQLKLLYLCRAHTRARPVHADFNFFMPGGVRPVSPTGLCATDMAAREDRFMERCAQAAAQDYVPPSPPHTHTPPPPPPPP